MKEEKGTLPPLRGSRGAPRQKKGVSPQALHEAAHAVMAYLLWHRVKRLQIVDKTLKKGEQAFTVYGPPVRKRKMCPIAHVMIGIAGSEAEVLWQGMDKYSISRSDQNALLEMGLSPLGFKLILPSVRRLLRKEKKTVFRVARILDAKGHLTGRQFKEMLK